MIKHLAHPGALALAVACIAGIAIAPPAATQTRDPTVQSCQLGASRTVHPYSQGLSDELPAVLIGCGVLPHAWSFELVAYRVPEPGRGGYLCLDIYSLPKTLQYPCLDHLVNDGTAIEVEEASPGKTSMQVIGATSGGVASVEVEYRRRGLRHRRAGFVKVADPSLLQRIGAQEPFGFYLAQLPSTARKVSVIAKDSVGRTIGRRRAPAPPPGVEAVPVKPPKGAPRIRIPRLTRAERARAKRIVGRDRRLARIVAGAGYRIKSIGVWTTDKQRKIGAFMELELRELLPSVAVDWPLLVYRNKTGSRPYRVRNLRFTVEGLRSLHVNVDLALRKVVSISPYKATRVIPPPGFKPRPPGGTD